MQAVAAAPSAGALERALAAAAAKPASISNASKSGGEFEAADWWEEHAETFALARSEWGRLHPGLYDLAANEADYIDPSLRAAVAAAEAAAMAGGPVDEAPLRSLLKPTGVAGVWRLQLFTPRFCAELREELDHAAASGVPIRRPNGMNRFGAILEAVPGGLGMEGAMRHLAHRYGRPLSQMAFPSSVGLRDADEHYGFVVRYRPGEDESLAEHADASVATINVNLADGFRGGRLTFKGTRFVDADPRNAPAAAVDFEDFAPGEALLHLGGHYHAAEPIQQGERTNMVLWLMGEHGVVRVAPYERGERGRTTPLRRWGGAEASGRWEALLRGEDGGVAGGRERDEL